MGKKENMDTEVVGSTTNTRFDGTVDQKYVYQRTHMKYTDEGMVEVKTLFWKTEAGNKRKVRAGAISRFPVAVLKQINDDLYPMRAAKKKEDELAKKNTQMAREDAQNDSARSSESSAAQAQQRRDVRHAHVCGWPDNTCQACDEGFLCYETWKVCVLFIT